MNVRGVDQNIMDNDDKLKDKQKKTDVTEIIREAPDKDEENRIFKKVFLKTNETVNVESKKVGVTKLNSRYMSLQKLISFVVYTTDCITCTSVNMMRWAGRASMVIMNQEEKNVNRNTSEDNDNVNYVALGTALGGACLYKFAMLGKAGVTNPLKTRTVLMRLGMDVTKAKRWVSSEVAVAVK